MKRFFSLFVVMTRFERWAVAILTLLFVTSGTVLALTFHSTYTDVVPAPGGTYIEGSVGQLQQLNPWFTVTNDVNRDIVSLVFRGLLAYNPHTKKIEEDLATMQISPSGKTYTLRLKDDLFWHDSTEEHPHPVTADDVLFTFATIEDPAFPNMLLRENFRGVQVEKVDNRTVKFILEEPYTFFPSNLTLGLLPAASFQGVRVDQLDQSLDFGFNPVGCGPYKIKSITYTELSSEVTLERFDQAPSPAPHLDRVVFRIFPDYSTLLSDIRNLDAVRVVPRNDKGEPLIPRRFVAVHYTLPQYVALFFNLDRKAVQDQKLRLGLQLGTNKLELLDAIRAGVIVDTPLLEIDMSEWSYHYDPNAAAGAFFESDWNLPEKIRLQQLLERADANTTGILHGNGIALLETGAVVTFSGSFKDAPRGSKLNGLPLQPTAVSGAWIVALPTARGTGSIKLGDNLLRLTNNKGRTLDSFYLFRTVDPKEFARVEEEQRLLQMFLKARAEKKSFGFADLFVDRGMLRKRSAEDPVSIRRDNAGNPLSLILLTSGSPPEYARVAKLIQKQWAALGVQTKLVIPDSAEQFQEKMQSRDYDVLLFGQSLLDNLDSFPYWHSSGRQKLTGKRQDLRLDAYNLSQYASFKADSLLEVIRRTRDEKERASALKDLQNVLKSDIPAVFLYSPLYTYAYHQSIQGVDLGTLTLHSDRLLTLGNWYLKERRIFKDGKSWFSFFPWLFGRE